MKDLKLEIKYLPLEEVMPYANNARLHGEEDIDAIMASIQEFGFNDPIGIWHGIIVEGHGRLIAAKRLGMETVPTVSLDHLTDEERKAYALAHNRTAELSGWNFIVRDEELANIANIDMSQFGFTENEVKKALKEYMLENEMDKVRYWYDGFNFGKRRDIYNPWSIVNFLDEGKFTNYWTNTSSNALISRLLKEGEAQFKICLESLVKGESIVCSIDEEIVFNQLNKRSGALWSLMVASGYLKITDIEGDGRNAKYTLSLTNMEVRDMVSDMIEEWFSWEGDGDYNGFVSALLRENLKEMNAYMNRLTLSVISSFDSGIKPSEKIPENFYHGFVLGLIVTLQGRYVITSNRESGLGRYDVIMEPLNPQENAILIEFKVFDPDEEKNLEETVKRALNQIEEKQYDRYLLDKGFAKNAIRKYGFAFRGKEVLIGE